MRHPGSYAAGYARRPGMQRTRRTCRRRPSPWRPTQLRGPARSVGAGRPVGPCTPAGLSRELSRTSSTSAKVRIRGRIRHCGVSRHNARRLPRPRRGPPEPCRGRSGVVHPEAARPQPDCATRPGAVLTSLPLVCTRVCVPLKSFSGQPPRNTRRVSVSLYWVLRGRHGRRSGRDAWAPEEGPSALLTASTAADDLGERLGG